jgi:hypothetical protein
MRKLPVGMRELLQLSEGRIACNNQDAPTNGELEISNLLFSLSAATP